MTIQERVGDQHGVAPVVGTPVLVGRLGEILVEFEFAILPENFPPIGRYEIIRCVMQCTDFVRGHCPSEETIAAFIILALHRAQTPLVFNARILPLKQRRHQGAQSTGIAGLAPTLS